MFTENNLQELLIFSAPAPVLSMYLNTEPSENDADAYKLRMRNMLKNIDLPQDVEQIERYFDHEYDRSGRSVAVFSCASQDFFRAYPLSVPVHDLAHVGDRPSVKPLATLLDNYGGYGVVLIDKQGARMFYFHLGELIEQEGVLGETIKQTKRGGASAMPGRRSGSAGHARSVDITIERNMKESSEFAVKFFEEKHVRRILISGTEDNLALFRNHLPKAWQSLIVGAFPVSMNASHTEVLERAMQAGTEAMTKREQLLVEDVITTASKGGNASIGLEATLSAVNEGRVQLLLISEGYHEKGFRCKNCGDLLVTDPEHACSACDDKGEPVPDIVELAVSAVLRLGGDIEVIHNNASMQEKGNIAALLRY
jgi:peptide chain release factor subunit 1